MTDMHWLNVCAWSRNNELQFAGTYGETGVRYTLSLPAGDMEARSRQVTHLYGQQGIMSVAKFSTPQRAEHGT